MKKRLLIALAITMLGNCFTAPTVTAQQLSGGWELPEKITLSEDAENALKKALEGWVGVEYEPLALLGTQIVAGTNYSILCKATGVYPDAVPYYTILYIYEDLQGEAAVLRIQDLELSADEPVVEDATEAEAVTGEAATEDEAQEYSITIRSGEDLITACPESAREGETVRIETFFVTDATLSVEVEDVYGYFVSEGVYEFEMPAHDVNVDADLEFDQPGVIFD